jgi:hypothetical protein
VFRLVGLSPRWFVSLALVGQVAVPLSSAVCAMKTLLGQILRGR